jgi:hypothetical protein
MPRGPLPAAAGDAPGSGSPGVMFWLNVAYRALPPMARVALAQQVRAWAEKAEQDALNDMAPRDPVASRIYDTTGQTRP